MSLIITEWYKINFKSGWVYYDYKTSITCLNVLMSCTVIDGLLQNTTFETT